MSITVDFSGRAALVIGGGGGGIGTAVVDVLARTGADVGIITNISEHTLASVAHVESMGLKAAGTTLDAMDEGSLVAGIGALAAQLGPFRYLVNVVGGAMADDWHRTSEYDMDSFDRVVNRNVRYAVVSCREVARVLLAKQWSGSIVNLSSVAARGTPLLAAYGASKAALESFGRTMALEWAPGAIRVNAIAPGSIKTPRAGSTDMANEAAKEVPLGRRGEPADIANAALFLLSDLAAYITGVTLTVDGGSSVSSRSGDTLPTFVTNPAVRARFGQ